MLRKLTIEVSVPLLRQNHSVTSSLEALPLEGTILFLFISSKFFFFFLNYY